MSDQIAVRIPATDLEAIDRIVAAGRFATRAEAFREAVRILLKAERNREIAEEYARAYGRQPDHQWVGRVGLELGGKLVADELPKSPVTRRHRG